eukprot:GHVR01002584.1.p1 GENE.GHVR01002584.1~~GHVR01002584.1.p1  ORF type:complete len:373 (-),score=93.27 GHVR01002584.1:550-1668(-)
MSNISTRKDPIACERACAHDQQLRDKKAKEQKIKKNTFEENHTATNVQDEDIKKPGNVEIPSQMSQEEKEKNISNTKIQTDPLSSKSKSTIKSSPPKKKGKASQMTPQQRNDYFRNNVNLSLITRATDITPEIIKKQTVKQPSSKSTPNKVNIVSEGQKIADKTFPSSKNIVNTECELSHEESKLRTKNYCTNIGSAEVYKVFVQMGFIHSLELPCIRDDELEKTKDIYEKDGDLKIKVSKSDQKILVSNNTSISQINNDLKKLNTLKADTNEESQEKASINQVSIQAIDQTFDETLYNTTEIKDLSTITLSQNAQINNEENIDTNNDDIVSINEGHNINSKIIVGHERQLVEASNDEKIEEEFDTINYNNK